ncbi:HD superfamily hydrolase [Amycolatopsis mediterranei S699]|uniref:Predicted HD superfamily hydrolase n=2 Tax=Amycolatopsis mediterranei TaxID=33910 RepID=A0A0H3DI80_AMYMU|nr:HD domain-containing protein [Amycolatopsis mediterranei]ADJ50386.1 predicted HD superfamily hydrolase [Amycolatopsis mediterranei U32]AEK47387.1 HD superfamily hydrolase [Amycolatopsis mediterranei S699]AFO82093.1 HD superfamily hydrolase [Amycolatopsis mediterranei S699]AGT89222.1 HD superfamily hydrolase [Amycolatopsis mediterranei RB]KDO08228.1 HD family phosphohydrolase [Amycolatopsis mediterranei]
MRTQESTIDHVIVDAVGDRVHRLCREYADRLPFHGWHHVNFVRTKAAGFARHNGADAAVVEVAALVHDVNYLVLRNSPAAAGRSLRREILAECGVPARIAQWIDEIVDEAEMATRGRDISLEAQALSDADTLFKALPVTPVVLAHRYLRENGLSLRELAHKIVGEQCDVHDEGYYFYNPEAAATYSHWATANLRLWQCIKEAVDDPTVAELLDAVAS